MHFSLVKIMPHDVAPPHSFDDVILPLYHALLRVGFNAEMRVNTVNHDSVNILFGTCLIPGVVDDQFPPNSIVFNLEQLVTRSRWNNERYIEHLRRFTVWDYSPRNTDYLREECGIGTATLLRLGYVPEMSRLNRDFPQDIDVLFYGSLNERRAAVLEGLADSGLQVVSLAGVYGAERDLAIARAKIILNVHYYTPASLEIVRLGYLWANRKAVVSELRPDTECYPGLEKVCLFSPYEKLRPAVFRLLHDEAARHQQEEAAFETFSRLRQEDFLKEVLGPRMHAVTSGARKLPRHLHAGSGRDFRQNCLNVDIAASMNPDLVLDLSLPLDAQKQHHTVRFGEIRLAPGSFARITAFELLEHVADLPQLMRNFLDLLGDGGELEITVPYDLSLGAWQNPAHVRAFNENSWLYYTSRAWQLGWREHKFDLVSFSYTLSKYGNELTAQGRSQEEIRRVPRAVDGMHVLLRKRRATDAEKEYAEAMARSYYKGAAGDWIVTEGSVQ